MTDEHPRLEEPSRLEELIDDALDLIAASDLQEARVRHQEACRLEPSHREVLLLEVEILKAEGQGEEAVAACEEILDRRPGDMLVAYTLATLLLDIYDDVQGARPILEGVKAQIDDGKKPDLGDSDPDHLAEAAANFHVDLLLTLSDCRGADQDPKGALEAALAAAALDADEPQARVCVAAAHFDLAELDEAEKVVARAIDLDPRLPDAYWLRGRILTLKGDDPGAGKAFARACLIDPERFDAPLTIDDKAFAKLVEAGRQELSKKVQTYLEKATIDVEPIPDLERLAKLEAPLSPGLLGLYGGQAPTLRESDDPWAHVPTKITLFQKNLQIAARDETDLRDLIAATLWHEIGHFLGLDEEALEEHGFN